MDDLRILLLEHDDAAREVTVGVFARHGIRAEAISDARGALAQLDASPVPIRLAYLAECRPSNDDDVSVALPIAEQIRRHNPHCLVVIGTRPDPGTEPETMRARAIDSTLARALLIDTLARGAADLTTVLRVVMATLIEQGQLLRQLWSVGDAGAFATAMLRASSAKDPEPTPPDSSSESIDFERAVALLRRRYRLTDMQCVVLALRFRGYANAMIADALGVEPGTVKARINDAKHRIGAPRGVHVDFVLRLAIDALRKDGAVPSGMLEAQWYRTLLRARRQLEAKHPSPPGHVDDPEVM